MSDLNGWIGVDLDGTLAEYGKWEGPEHIGAPVPLMVGRVKEWLDQDKDVRIFTARVFPLYHVNEGDTFSFQPEATDRRTTAIKAALAIQRWCREHIGQVLPITCVKDYGMVELWDDRTVQIIKNTGFRADLGWRRRSRP